MRCVTICLVFGLLSAAPAYPQLASDQTAQATNPSRVADVYIQTQKGVDVYNANASGQLVLVKGSAFADTGQMEAVRGNALISIGTDHLHTYALRSDGGVGGQLGQINTQSYGGSQCGNTDQAGSILDHTGTYLSVQLYGALNPELGTYLCSAWQTYKIAPNGQLSFLGDAVNTSQYSYEESAQPSKYMTVSSNNQYAYGSEVDPDNDVFVPFKRASAGDLVYDGNFSEVGPTPNPADGSIPYVPDYFMAADNANHLAVVVAPNRILSGSGPDQVASYTINPATGAIQSTNTWANMPALATGEGNSIAMSWAGNLLAVGGTPGMQLFHFNGAAPATKYSGVLLPKVEIDRLGWDKNNHLYALSYASGELYVYTVTPTSIQEAPGSPHKVPGAYGVTGIIVVPRS